MMKEHQHSRRLSEEDVERLLRNAPPIEHLSAERRRAIWENISAHLERSAAKSLRRSVGHLGWRRIMVWSSAALAATAAILIFVFSAMRTAETPHNLIGKVEIVRGDCFRTTTNESESPVEAGTSLKAGDRLRVGPRGGLRLKLEDGSTIWLCADTEVIFIGPRSSKSPSMSIIRGEMRADIVRDEKNPFLVETPAATLRVLGTQFHCRVLPGLEKEEETMTRLRTVLSKLVVVVTVLSGAVAVQAESGEQVIQQGERTIVTAGALPTASETVEKLEYLRKWLGEPGKQAAPETLVSMTIPDNLPDVIKTLGLGRKQYHLIQSLWAVNVDTGKTRHITDFIGFHVRVAQRLGPHLAIVNVSKPGPPPINHELILVDLNTGEKIPMAPLRQYEAQSMELSPDGRKLAFVGYKLVEESNEKNFGLFVLDLETFKVRMLLKGVFKTCPHWSPDSRWLSITTAEGYPHDPNQYKISLIDTVTGQEIKTGLVGAGIYFTPDGKRLLYSSGFKKSGSWSGGVPMWGNLFMADVQTVEPEQITFLPEGGAVKPSFSPDGSRLAYWEASIKREEPSFLHILDFDSWKDRVITKEKYRGDVQWLDDNSKLLLSRIEYDQPDDRKVKVKLIELVGDKVRVNKATYAIPTPTDEQIAAANNFVSRFFMKGMLLFRGIQEEQDLHRIEAVQKKWHEAHDFLKQIVNSLGPEGPFAALKLSPADLDVYLEMIEPHLHERH